MPEALEPFPHDFPARFDVAIIGGGVVGCAMARRFTLEGAKAILLEKEPDILSGASKANSALLHNGFDEPPGSIELECVSAGYSEYMEIRKHLNLPLLRTDGLVVAWDEEQRAKLPGILEHAQGNGIEGVRRVDGAELRRREPHLAKDALKAVLIPGEHVIDPWSAPLAYLRQAIAMGAVAVFCSPLEEAAFDGETWSLETPRGQVRAGTVINCAGLYGDIVERLCRESPFLIKPRKGQFLVFDKPAHQLANAIILPVPTERTKGVLIARTVFGNLLVGPTAEDQDDRDKADVTEEVLRKLRRQGERMIPSLVGETVTATYAGLRPATEYRDFQISSMPEKRWISVGGIRSTGLTACLGIASYVHHIYQEHGNRHQRIEPVWTPVPNLAEHKPRDYYNSGYEEIICHCELVTLREIEQALDGPLPARDIGGLKRRTRAMMGRCQGFYCGGRIAALTDKRLQRRIAVGKVP
jgi:glycerol-3-phosphate dehydrogenase